MRAKTITIDPDAVDANGIYTIAVVEGTGALTLAGALVTGTVATMDYARRIGILSSGNDVGITFTIVGTDADGRALSEAVTGASGGTAESAGYFKTITSITASGAAAANVTVGTVDEFVTNVIPLNHHAADAHTVSIELVTGTINFSIVESFSDMWDSAAFVFTACATALTAITAVAHANLDTHVTGIRFVCNSHSTGAAVKMVVIQNG